MSDVTFCLAKVGLHLQKAIAMSPVYPFREYLLPVADA